jgi:hypothetical protein
MRRNGEKVFKNQGEKPGSKNAGRKEGADDFSRRSVDEGAAPE